MSDKKKWQAVQEAVRQNDAAQVKTATSGLKMHEKDEYFDACAAAVTLGSGTTLRALLEAGGGFYFSNKVGMYRRGDENKELVQQLIKNAYDSPNPSDVLPVLYSNIRKGPFIYRPPSLKDFLNEHSPLELLEACLKDKEEKEAFVNCVEKVGLFSTEKLEFIAAFATDHVANGSGSVLAQALITVAERNDIDAVKVLLAHGADANFDTAEALRAAAKNGCQEMVDILIPYVAIEKLGRNIVIQLEKLSANPAIIQSIEAAVQKASQKTVVEAAPPVAPPQQQDGRFQRLDEDTLFETKKFPDGSTLTTLFNFSTRQQDKILKNENGETFAYKPVNFSALDPGVEDIMRARFDALAEQEPAAATPKDDNFKQLRRAIR